MSVPAANFVASGCSYVVTEVGSRPPISLDDFVGHTEFTAVRDNQHCGVAGVGGSHGGVVRFHEKEGGTGKDLRVWQIAVTEGAAFEATTVSNY